MRSSSDLAVKVWHRARDLAQLLFAATLVLAGIMKLRQPEVAAIHMTHLLGSALPLGCACLAVVVGAAAQVALGAALVLLPTSAVAVGGGLMMAALLGAIEAWGLAADVESPCGCFGAAATPRWLSSATILLGVIALAPKVTCSGVAAVSRRQRRVLIGVGALMLVASMAGFAVCVSVSLEENPTAALDRALGEQDTRPALVIVGSGDCAHCCDMLRYIETVPDSEVNTKSWRLVLVVREDVLAGCVASAVRVERVAVPDQLWWSLVRGQPPSYYSRTPDAGILPMDGADSFLAMLQGVGN